MKNGFFQHKPLAATLALNFSFLLITLILPAQPSLAGAPLSIAAKGNTIAPMLEQTMPGVVNISTKAWIRGSQNPLLEDPFFRFFFDVPKNQPRRKQTQALGSGVIIDAKKGYIITNNHVIDHADEISVTLRDGRELDAKLIGTDKEADIAVLQVPANNLTALPLADSETLRVGDFVVAIGNPFGLGQTVTSGIISALGRSGLGIEGYEDFIQTDASINPGNSGGALVNFDGELIGINTAIIGPSGGNVGIGFAIPINMAKSIVQQLVKYGEVKRGSLGVVVQDITADLSSAFGLEKNKGVIVSQVLKGSTADQAGLKQGDIILSIDKHKVNSSSDLRNAIGLQHVGKPVEMEIVRNGEVKILKGTINEPKQVKFSGDSVNKRLAGVTFGEIGPGHSLYGRIEGVEVLELKKNSQAWDAGIRPHDIIVSVNRRRISNQAEMQQAAENTRGLLINLRREDGAYFVVIR